MWRLSSEAARDTRATAVPVFNDLVALGLMNRLLSRGVSIPEDVSIPGFDDAPVARM